MNLIGTFITNAARHPGKTAIIDGYGRAITFGELVVQSANLASGWRERGLKAGDRVVLAMGIGIDLYVALAALWRLGAVVVFPEPALGLNGLKFAAEITKPRGYLASGWYRALRWLVPDLRSAPLALTPRDHGIPVDTVALLSGELPALISFTSGSTGEPKTIVRTHAFLAAQNARVADLLRPGAEGAVDLIAFPVFVIANLGLGITSVLPNWNVRRHDAADGDAIVRHMLAHGVTRALLPPAVCERLAASRTVPPLQAIFTGGGPVFPDVLQRLAARMPGADIVAVYGSTEAEPIAHLHVRDITTEDWNAMTSGAGLLAGTPIPEIRVRISDDEIIVTGDHVNKSYLDVRQNAANKLAIDSEIWHRTGDAGRRDRQGRLWLLGRHEARVGGLYPFCVEVAARTWPGVQHAALIGLNGKPLLVLVGDPAHEAEWQDNARAIGCVAVHRIQRMPLDRRHRSKIDYAALRALLSARM